MSLPSFDGIGSNGEREETLMAGSERAGKTVQLLTGMTFEQIKELVDSVESQLVYQTDVGEEVFDVYLLQSDTVGLRLAEIYIYFKDGVMVGFVREVPAI